MEKYLVFNEGIHEFNVEREVVKGGIKLSLFYAENGHWTYPNKMVFSILDDGNGFDLSKKIARRLDYDVASYLKILIHISNISDNNPKNALPYEIFAFNKISEVV